MATYKKTCEICGKEFETQWAKQILCSKECQEEKHRRKQKELARKKAGFTGEKICRYCGKSFHIDGPAQYCSDECRKEALNKMGREKYQPKQPRQKTCPVCGTVFYTKNTKRFCSDICRDIASGKRKAETTKQTKQEQAENAEILPSGRNANRPLTPDTEYYVYIWYKQGDSPEKIALALDRTVDSIKDILRRHGLLEKD